MSRPLGDDALEDSRPRERRRSWLEERHETLDRLHPPLPLGTPLPPEPQVEPQETWRIWLIDRLPETITCGCALALVLGMLVGKCTPEGF